MSRNASAVIPAGFGLRTLAKALAVVALIAGALMVDGPRAAWGQEEPSCDVTDLGTLGADADGELRVEGRWTTADCDSRFRIDSDAHTYRFEITEPGRVRINLTSADGDPYLYLLAEDGSRVTDDDEGGAILNARIERDLATGVYLVEATTVGGRGRGAADFTLSVHYVTGCEPIGLGVLEPGVDLTASGTWTLDVCGSRFVVAHPAHTYFFHLPMDGRVLIDLTSVNGDPVLSLFSPEQGVIGANDDGGGRRDARIEEYVTAGTYLIEATTYFERGLQPVSTDFDLVVHLVDEEAEQHRSNLKVEAIHTPDQVVAGEPFHVHYRAGNLGGGGLSDVGGGAVLYVVGPGDRAFTDPIWASELRWRAGVSYHSGPQTASATSTTLDQVAPFTLTLDSPGPSWVFVGVVAVDGLGREIGFHGIWRNLTVLSGVTFDPVTVSADGDDYAVSAAANSRGLVTVAVRAVADPEAAIGRAQRAKAIYAAGVRARVLDGILERPAIAALRQQHEGVAETEGAAPVVVANPSSRALLAAFADHHANAIATSGVAARVAAGELISQAAVEDLTLSAAEAASAQWLSLAAAWSALQERIAGGAALSFADALAVQSQLAYAERIIAPIVAGGEIVRAARAAELGWDDAAVRAMVADLAAGASCAGGAGALIALDAELRAALPIHGLVDGSVLCGVAEADAATARFLRGLTIAGSSELRALVAPAPPAPPAAYRLRVIARLAEDGRVEHGVELANGQRIFPSVRFLPTSAAVGAWKITSAVEVGGVSIGWIRSQRLADGRVEVGFRSAGGGLITPAIRYLPADVAVGVWLRSSEIGVPPVAPSVE